jgi:hypothetical protein
MGKESKKFNLHIRVEIREADNYSSSSGLSVMESVSVSCTTFLEIAHVLAQFHELTEAIKREKGGS